MSLRNFAAVVVLLFAFIVVLACVTDRTAGAENNEPDPLWFSSCKNVTFMYKNGTNKYTQVTKVKYYNGNERNWKTETIPFNYCPPNQTNCSMPAQDLGDSESDDITSIIYEFKTSASFNGPWGSSAESSEFHPDIPKCKAGKSYGSGTDWIVTAGGSGGTTNSDSDCKGVSFKLTNGRTGTIRIEKLTYFNVQAGKWRDEKLNGDECLQGQTCTITREFDLMMRTPINLKDANGHDVSKVKFSYKFLSNARGSKWTSPIESKIFEPVEPTCVAGKVFGKGQVWTIGTD